jgi:hypothetical protein
MPEKLIIIHFHESGNGGPIEVHVWPMTSVRSLLKSLNREGFCLFRESSGLMLSLDCDVYGLEDGEHLIGIKNTWANDFPDD